MPRLRSRGEGPSAPPFLGSRVRAGRGRPRRGVRRTPTGRGGPREAGRRPGPRSGRITKSRTIPATPTAWQPQFRRRARAGVWLSWGGRFEGQGVTGRPPPCPAPGGPPPSRCPPGAMLSRPGLASAPAPAPTGRESMPTGARGRGRHAFAARAGFRQAPGRAGPRKHGTRPRPSPRATPGPTPPPIFSRTQAGASTLSVRSEARKPKRHGP